LALTLLKYDDAGWVWRKVSHYRVPAQTTRPGQEWPGFVSCIRSISRRIRAPALLSAWFSPTL